MSSMMGNEPAGYRSPMAPTARTVKALYIVYDSADKQIGTFLNQTVANRFAIDNGGVQVLEHLLS